MQNKRSQPEVNRIMPETKLTEIRGLSIDRRVESFWSVSETDGRLYFLPLNGKRCFYHSGSIISCKFFTINVEV